MRPLVLLAALAGLAGGVAAEGGVRVERTGTSSRAPAPWPERPRLAARVVDGAVEIDVTGWSEGCTSASAPPRFAVTIEGGAIRLEREGRAPAPRCRPRRAHDDAFCAGPGGEMMDCPPPVCLCAYRLSATVRPPRAGSWRILVQDPAGVRARTTVLVR